jgi:hypothetical protein
VSNQVQGFTEAQVQEMATRGAALDGTRPSDWLRRAEETSGDDYRPVEDADSCSGRWPGLPKIESKLAAS